MSYRKVYSNTKKTRLDIRIDENLKKKAVKDAHKYNISTSAYIGELIKTEQQSRTMREKVVIRSLTVMQTQTNEALKLCKEDSEQKHAIEKVERELEGLWQILNTQKKIRE